MPVQILWEARKKPSAAKGPAGIGTRREHEYTPDETRALEAIAALIGGFLRR